MTTPSHTHPHTQHLKQQLSVEEVNVQYLIDLGNTILACVQPEGEAEMYIDTCLSEVEQLWYKMDTQVCVCVCVCCAVA